MRELKIKYVEAKAIRPYKNNARTHSAEQIEQLKKSITEFGMLTPIALHKGEIVYGHARFQALKELGHTKFPTVDVSHLSAAQKKAYTLADNRLALNADWDMGMLNLEMTGLQDDGFDLSLIGFDDDELADIFADPTVGLTDPDDVPGLPDEPVTKPGDVWLLGAKVTCPKCGKETPVVSAQHSLADQP